MQPIIAPNCAGIQRLICINTSKVYNVLSNSVNPTQRDMILVIVNDPEYGGSRGAIAVASTHSSVVELVLHEIGHSFGLLADEYDNGPPSCNNTVEPSEPNATKETVRALIKWNVGGGPPTGWIDFSTPIPTPYTSPGIPGVYEGARYCPTGLYRPTHNSKMRSLNNPFEQINEEQLVKRCYNFVSPLDSSSPAETDVTLFNGQIQIFQVSVPNPLTHSLEVTWFVNDQEVGTDLQYTFASTDFDSGTYIVKDEIKDPTPKVRNDPAQVLSASQSWTVRVVVNTSTTTTTAGTTTTTVPGTTTTTFPGTTTTTTSGTTTTTYACECPNTIGGCISGKVTNGAGKMVKLKKKGTPAVSTTVGPNDCYEFKNLADGTYKVKVQGKKCKPKRQKETVTGNNRNGVNFSCR